MVDKIWIEEKDYEDKTEFRVKTKVKYPYGTGRKGYYEICLGEWVTKRDGKYPMIYFKDYLFIAYKKKLNWFEKLIGKKDYEEQKRIIIQKCDKLIDEWKKGTKTKTTKYMR